MNWRKITCFCLSVFLLIACGEDRTYEYEALTGAQQWIYKTAQTDYLYAEDLPALEQKNYFLAPDEFLQRIASDKDKKGSVYFSHIDSVDAVSEKINVVPTLGMETILLSGNSTVARVLYTYSQSPASDIGLTRGDWIIAINGETITNSNYLSALVSPKSSCTLTLGSLRQDGGFDTLRNVSIPAPRKVEKPSVYHHSIVEINGKKVAYLMYTSFSSDMATLKNITATWKSSGVEDVVLDLRYNNQGTLEQAKEMGTLLLPATAMGKSFLQLSSNSTLNKKETLLWGESATIGNKRLFVITSSTTRATAEALIHGLKPYWGDHLKVIGQTTTGQNVAQTRYTNPLYPALELWLTTSLITNTEGATYAEGIAPDYTIEENWGAPMKKEYLGTPNEGIFAAVAYYIINDSFPTSEKEVNARIRVQNSSLKGLMFTLSKE